MENKRRRMIERHLVSRGIRDPAVLAAMETVPREAFIAAEMAEFAYEDAPLPIEAGQTISQPFIVAEMTAALELEPHHRVLEIGTGSGYAAAVLSRIAAEVYTVERIGALAKAAQGRLAELGYANVNVREGDGSLGWPEHAPYDAILVTAAAPRVPEALRSQLVVGGRLVIPVGAARAQRLVRVTRTEAHDYAYEDLENVAFVPLIGAEGWPDESGE